MGLAVNKAALNFIGRPILIASVNISGVLDNS